MKRTGLSYRRLRLEPLEAREVLSGLGDRGGNGPAVRRTGLGGRVCQCQRVVRLRTAHPVGPGRGARVAGIRSGWTTAPTRTRSCTLTTTRTITSTTSPTTRRSPCFRPSTATRLQNDRLDRCGRSQLGQLAAGPDVQLRASNVRMDQGRSTSIPAGWRQIFVDALQLWASVSDGKVAFADPHADTGLPFNYSGAAERLAVGRYPHCGSQVRRSGQGAVRTASPSTERLHRRRRRAFDSAEYWVDADGVRLNQGAGGLATTGYRAAHSLLFARMATDAAAPGQFDVEQAASTPATELSADETAWNSRRRPRRQRARRRSQRSTPRHSAESFSDAWRTTVRAPPRLRCNLQANSTCTRGPRARRP